MRTLINRLNQKCRNDMYHDIIECLVAVYDSIDAMASDRPYRKALSWKRCKNEIMLSKGRQFDVGLVEAALRLMPVWQEKFLVNQ